jgi:hypothetical protein
MKIYTHQNVDIDCASVVCLALINTGQSIALPGMDTAHQIVFVPADWEKDDTFVEGDLILDLFAGDKGDFVDTVDGIVVRSAFSKYLRERCSKDFLAAFSNLADFIDAEDTTGDWRTGYYGMDAVEESKTIPTVHDAFLSIKAFCRDRTPNGERSDLTIIQHWFGFISGTLARYYKWKHAKKVANKCQVLEGLVGILKSSNSMVSRVLFDQGAEFVVYEHGYNIGVLRHPESKVNIGKVLSEQFPEWFHHPGGFLSCWGSLKAPKYTSYPADAEYVAELMLSATSF